MCPEGLKLVDGLYRTNLRPLGLIYGTLRLLFFERKCFVITLFSFFLLFVMLFQIGIMLKLLLLFNISIWNNVKNET